MQTDFIKKKQPSHGCGCVVLLGMVLAVVLFCSGLLWIVVRIIKS